MPILFLFSKNVNLRKEFNWNLLLSKRGMKNKPKSDTSSGIWKIHAQFGKRKSADETAGDIASEPELGQASGISPNTPSNRGFHCPPQWSATSSRQNPSSSIADLPEQVLIQVLRVSGRSRTYGVCWKKPPATFSPIFRAHVPDVRSARKTGCGLAGRTFFNRPEASWHATSSWSNLSLDILIIQHSHMGTLFSLTEPYWFSLSRSGISGVPICAPRK